MTKDEYKEMITDIIDNGAEYEIKCKSEITSKTEWHSYNLSLGYMETFELRKKQHKTWLEEQLESCVQADIDEVTDFIKDFYKELTKRIENYTMCGACGRGGNYITPQEIKSIVKDMGITEE